MTVFDLCTSSGHALYFYQVLWNYLERYQSYRADTISILKISKGNNSAKNVGGVTVVNLCTSSDHALHLCQVSWNYLERYQSYRADTNDQPLMDGRTDGRTDGLTDTQKFGGYNIIPRHFLWRGITIINTWTFESTIYLLTYNMPLALAAINLWNMITFKWNLINLRKATKSLPDSSEQINIFMYAETCSTLTQSLLNVKLHGVKMNNPENLMELTSRKSKLRLDIINSLRKTLHSCMYFFISNVIVSVLKRSILISRSKLG